MSDLSRLRARLVRIERRGKLLRAEMDELRSRGPLGPEPLTRTEERHTRRLDAELAQCKADYKTVWNMVRREESRLITDPTAPLRFT